MIRILLLLTSLVLAACGSNPPLPDELPDEQGVTLLDQPVELRRSRQDPEAHRMLDIGIRVFDVEQQNTGPAAVGDSIFREILEIESQYLPVVFRNTLVESNYWGALRVLPRVDPAMDIQIEGTIHESSGVFLDISLVATDSTGYEWLNRRYRFANDGSGTQDRNQDRGQNDDQDPFQSVYNQFANDLADVLASRTEEQILNIQRVTNMRYAADLSPETFADTLAPDENGYTEVVRLLADNDPMLDRLGRMQLRHHIFIDTLDEYYQALQQDMQHTYDLWRVYSREQILEIEIEQRTRSDLGNSGFQAIANNWYRYQSNRMFEQEWNELAEGFTNEVAPSILELNRRVYGLSGNVQDQYDQWRELLKQFYLLERGE